MTTDTEVKPKLSKHLQAAVNQLEKQTQRYELKIAQLNVARIEIDREVKDLEALKAGLHEQISKLKGE